MSRPRRFPAHVEGHRDRSSRFRDPDLKDRQQLHGRKSHAGKVPGRRQGPVIAARRSALKAERLVRRAEREARQKERDAERAEQVARDTETTTKASGRRRRPRLSPQPN